MGKHRRVRGFHRAGQDHGHAHPHAQCHAPRAPWCCCPSCPATPWAATRECNCPSRVLYRPSPTPAPTHPAVPCQKDQLVNGWWVGPPPSRTHRRDVVPQVTEEPHRPQGGPESAPRGDQRDHPQPGAPVLDRGRTDGGHLGHSLGRGDHDPWMRRLDEHLRQLDPSGGLPCPPRQLAEGGRVCEAGRSSGHPLLHEAHASSSDGGRPLRGDGPPGSREYTSDSGTSDASRDATPLTYGEHHHGPPPQQDVDPPVRRKGVADAIRAAHEAARQRRKRRRRRAKPRCTVVRPAEERITIRPVSTAFGNRAWVNGDREAIQPLPSQALSHQASAGHPSGGGTVLTMGNHSYYILRVEDGWTNGNPAGAPFFSPAGGTEDP